MTMFLAIMLTLAIALVLGFFGAHYFMGYMLVASRAYRNAVLDIIHEYSDEEEEDELDSN